MCGRFSLKHSRQEIVTAYGTDFEGPYAPRYNIAPTQPVLVYREIPHVRGQKELAHLIWGFIPSWADSPAMASNMINARAETAAEKPAFRHALKRRRCIIPASGYYEWVTNDSGSKYPVYSKLESDDLINFAGIWEAWIGPEGEFLESCAILTTERKRDERINHHRVPVIIPADKMDFWLESSNENIREITPYLIPPDNEIFSIYPVSTVVNNPRNDTPECIRPPGLFEL